MTSSYDIAQYLLDRADIQDVIELLYLYFDLGNYDKMKSDVFAENVTIDYTVLWGGDPFTVTGIELANQWEAGLQSKAAAAQHLVSSVVPLLPRPGGSVIPASATALANGSALIKSFKNNLVENTGRLHVDLTRTTPGESGANPWRISGLKASMVWQSDVPLEQLAIDYAAHHEQSQAPDN